MKGDVADRLGADLVEVCIGCGEVRGRWRSGLVQWCACDRAASPEPQPRWPHFDHNTAAELCRCCGLRLVESGSKWSVWLCRPCLGLVKAMNDEAGRCVFPIGRHSLMNGVGYRAGPQPSETALAAFSDQLHTFFRAAAGTSEWRKQVVAANAAAAELPAGGRVPLRLYLARVAAAGLEPEPAFEALREAAGKATP